MSFSRWAASLTVIHKTAVVVAMAVCAIAAALYIALGIQADAEAAADQRARMRDRLLAYTAAQQLGAMLDRRHHHLELVATAFHGSPGLDRESILRSFLELEPGSVAMILDPAGRVVAATDPALVGRDESADWFRRLTSGGEAVVEEFTPSSASGAKAGISRQAIALRASDQPSPDWVLATVVEIPELVQGLGTGGSLRNVTIIAADSSIIHAVPSARDGRCFACHTAEDVVRRVGGRDSGTIVHARDTTLGQTFSFATFDFANRPALLILPGREESAALFGRTRLRIGLLIALVTLVMIGAAALIHRAWREQLRARLEAREWREKSDLERQYRQLVEAIPGIVWSADAKTVAFLYVSEKSREILGYDPKNWLGSAQFWLDHLHPEDREWAPAFCAAQTKLGVPHEFEYRMIAADGRVVWLHDIVNVDVEDGEAKMLYGVMVDITRSKQAEMAMVASERRFRALFEQSPIGIAIRDADDRVTNVNPALCRMLGFEASELLAAGAEDLAHPDDVASSDDTVEKLLAPGAGAQHFERRYRRVDGSWAWGRTTRSVVRDEQGRLQFRVGIIEDITDQKRAWEERRRLATAIEHAGEAVVVTDVHGVIEYVNPAFETITGFTKAEAVGKLPSLVKSGVHDDAFYGDVWKQITGGGTWSGGLVNRRKDGSLYEAETTISPIFGESGEVTGFVAVQRDISEKVALLDKLRRAEDLQSFGRLVSGVAHEVRNPLAAIQAALGAIEIDLGNDEAHAPFFEIIRTQVERLTRLMRDLLDLAKPLQQSRIAIQAVDEMCVSSIAMWRHAKPEVPLSRIQFHSTTCASVRVDPIRMQQVIVNLLDNAIQHSPQDSVVTVSVDEVGESCRITVRDAGSGLTTPALGRIFEPFFTTRRGGTGLGLPLVRNIVDQLGGRVSLVNNDPPPGATAEILLPLAREAAGSPS